MTKRVVLALTLVLASCTAAPPPPAEETAGETDETAIDGDYSGSYTIIHDYGTRFESPEYGTVNVTFDRGHFSIVGLERLLPPAGSGTYGVVGDRIFLNDTAMHTADFDWTLIVQGEFEYEFDGTTLRMLQTDFRHKRHRELELLRQGERRN